MRTSAAMNKCEFGYTTPSGEERLGPTKFTLYAKYHKRSRGSGASCAHGHVARTANGWWHNEQIEEARRTQKLMARAKRERAPTRAQLQAARPEYTLSVKKEKQ
eukprot:354414-Pleurochrysis_carterae.AAC.1